MSRLFLTGYWSMRDAAVMSELIHEQGQPLVVMGYGSPLRGDDAAGYVLAVELEAEALAGVRCIATHQLTPDLAAELVGACRVVFADAAPADGLNAGVRVTAVRPASNNTGSAVGSHACTPSALLALAATLFDVRPEAKVIIIPGYDFSLRESMTGQTRAAVEQAKKLIRQEVGVYA